MTHGRVPVPVPFGLVVLAVGFVGGLAQPARTPAVSPAHLARTDAVRADRRAAGR